MPYLVKGLKEEIDTDGELNTLTNYLASLDESKFIGALNYINYRIIKSYVGIKGKSYFLFASILGSLLCCILEVYRRVVVGYEDEKIISNGDV